MVDEDCAKCRGSGHIVLNAGRPNQGVVECPDCFDEDGDEEVEK